MQKKRRFLVILLCLMLVFLSGCNNTGKEEKKSIKIGVTLYDKHDTFVSQMMEVFVEYTAKKEAETGTMINVEIYSAESDQSTQNEQVEMMLNDGCDVICVNLVDRTEPTTIIDMAENKGIPIIFFNRELVEEDLERWDQVYYVGASAFESGIMQGTIAAETFLSDSSMDKNGDGVLQYVMLEGEAGHQDSIVRTEYSVNAIVKQGIKVEKLGYAIANWNRDQAKTKMLQFMDEYGFNVELILANNDDMALGAIDALKSLNIDQSGWPVIVGIDGTDVGLEAVKNDEMKGTVYNDKEGQARAMMNLAFGLATDGDISYLKLEKDKYIRLPYSVVCKEDVDEYMEKYKDE